MMTAPLTAIGRLNSHARAAGPRSAIYAYKTLATMLAVAREGAGVRFVRWTGKCNRCENGRFTHWEWTDGYSVACRYCHGRGVKTLRFTEVTLSEGQVWHHPWEGFTSPGADVARAAGFGVGYGGDVLAKGGSLFAWEPAGEWKPLAPGQRLSSAELVDLLNEAEDWIEGLDLIPPNQYCRSALEKATGCLKAPSNSTYFSYTDGRRYSLDLGRALGGCFVCGDVADLAGYTLGCCTALFHWSLPVCNAHAKSPRPEAPPEAMLTPAVRRWMARRGA